MFELDISICGCGNLYKIQRQLKKAIVILIFVSVNKLINFTRFSKIIFFRMESVAWNKK
jgi:hypothetical protein